MRKAYCRVCQKKRKMKKLTYVDGDVDIMHKCTGCGTIHISDVKSYDLSTVPEYERQGF